MLKSAIVRYSITSWSDIGGLYKNNTNNSQASCSFVRCVRRIPHFSTTGVGAFDACAPAQDDRCDDGLSPRRSRGDFRCRQFRSRLNGRVQNRWDHISRKVEKEKEKEKEEEEKELLKARRHYLNYIVLRFYHRALPSA